MQVKSIFKKSKDTKTTTTAPKAFGSESAKSNTPTRRQHTPAQAQTQDVAPGAVVSYRNQESPAQSLLQSLLSRDAAQLEPRRLSRRGRSPALEGFIQEPPAEGPVDFTEPNGDLARSEVSLCHCHCRVHARDTLLTMV